MSNVDLIDAIHAMLHFDSCRSCIEGKIWIFWCDEFNIFFQELVDQMVSMLVLSSLGYFFCFSAIYARCTQVRRRSLWMAMEEVAAQISSLRIVASDFNVISKAKERSWWAPANIRILDEFNEPILI